LGSHPGALNGVNFEIFKRVVQRTKHGQLSSEWSENFVGDDPWSLFQSASFGSQGIIAPLLIFDIRALWRSGLSARVPKCQKLTMVG